MTLREQPLCSASMSTCGATHAAATSTRLIIAIDGFTGCKTATAEEPPDAVAVMDLILNGAPAAVM